jgi:hypothetical protein
MSKEVELGSFATALAIDSTAVLHKQFGDLKTLHVVLCSLADKCEPLIDKEGIYQFSVTVTRLK